MIKDRLIPEPLAIQHSKGMYKLWSDAKVCEYSGSADDFDGKPIQLPAQSSRDSGKIIDFFLEFQRRSEKVRWAMITKSDSKFIGALGFHTTGVFRDCAERYVLSTDSS